MPSFKHQYRCPLRVWTVPEGEHALALFILICHQDLGKHTHMHTHKTIYTLQVAITNMVFHLLSLNKNETS